MLTVRCVDMPDEIAFSVKELLETLNQKVDVIDQKLDLKADRDRVHDLQNRMAALELTAVRREGPIIDEIRSYEKRLDEVAYQVSRFENGVGQKIQQAIEASKRASQQAADRAFTRKEKILLGLFAGIGAVGTIVSTVVLLVQTRVT